MKTCVRARACARTRARVVWLTRVRSRSRLFARVW